MPHFVLSFWNTGDVPLTFSNFELVLPRRVVMQDGKFVSHLGAELFIDKRRSSRLGAFQHVQAIDYRTTRIELPPRSLHTEYFDLSPFLPKSTRRRWDPQKCQPTSNRSRTLTTLGRVLYAAEPVVVALLAKGHALPDKPITPTGHVLT